eukprot:g67841.t1
MALQAALASFRVGQHDVLTKFVAKYEGKSLDLSSQNLGAVGASAVAKGLQVNQTLTTLHLWDNNIGAEGAAHIAAAVKENKECKLQTLDISGNVIGPEGAAAIANMLKVNTALQVLNFYGNNIGPEGAAAIADMLKVNEALQVLILIDNNIGPEGAKAVANMLKVNQSIERIYIQGDWIPVAAVVIASLLTVNSTLTALDIGKNIIGPQGAQSIADAIKVNSTLISIKLEFNGIGPAGAQHIAKALEVNKTLQMLDIRWNEIGAQGAEHIAEALKVNSTLAALDIGGNGIGTQGAQSVADAIKDHPSVTSVDLRGNNLSVESGSALVAVAKQNPRIKEMCGIPLDSLRDNKTTELNLKSGGLGPAEAAILAELLKVNKTLQTLDISWNSIGAQGAEHIAEALKVNNTVQTLNLYGNNIGPDGAKAIGKALEVNATLILIDLQSNLIGSAGAQHIAKALEVNNTVQTLYLGGNKIGPDGAKAIGKALENNTTLTKLDGIENKKALRIVETNRSRVAELQELCSRGAARVGLVGPLDNTVLFKKGTNLQELVLQSSKIAHHSYFQELLVWISKHQHLRRLRLNAIGLTDNDLSVLVSSEDGLTFLEELDLRYNQLTTVPAELGDPKRFGKLQKLLVSRNAELLKRDDELGRRARSDVNVLGVDAGIQVLQLLRLGSSKLKQIPRTLLQLVTVGNFKVGKSTLLERGWLAPSLKRKTANWSRLERTTSVLLFNCLDSEAGLHWMVRDLPGQPEFYATNLHFLSADCAVFLLCIRFAGVGVHTSRPADAASAAAHTGVAATACPKTELGIQARAPGRFGHATGRNLLSIPDLANVPEFLVVAQDGLAKWRDKHLTKWHASYAEALEIVKSLLPTSAPELVLRELIYQGDVMEFGTELVLSPVWLALALAVIVRPHGHPFYGLMTNRGRVSRQDIQKALLEERWPASMSISRKRLCLHCRFGPKLAKEEDVPQVLRFLQVLDVIAPLSHKPEPLSAATPAPEPTEDSQAVAASPPPLFRQPSFDISSADQVMIPSSVGERYSGVIFAPRDLGFGFGELCLAAGVKFSQRTTSELVFPPGFMAVLAARLLSKKLGPERSASYFGTHEFCFREEDQPHTGDKGAVRAVLDEQGRELFLCVAGSKGFLCHYASSFVQEVLTVLRLPRWGRAEESACVAHLLCQNCLVKGRGPARDTSQDSNEICEVLDEQPWATGREGLSVLWGLSRHHDERGQQAKAVVSILYEKV